MTENLDDHIARLQTAARGRTPSEQGPPRRRWSFGVAAGLVVAGVIGASVSIASGGTVSTAEPVAAAAPKPVACHLGEHQSTPEAYYDCVNGAWVRGKAPTPTTTTPPATVPPATPPATAPPTTEAPTMVPPTAQPVETTTPPPPPPGPAPTIDITCPTPKTSAADSLRADFGYDFDATTPALVRWGIEYGDGRSYKADNEAKARTQAFWHRYRSPGTYTATAWVEDAIGRRASDSCQFTWTAPPAPPPPPPPTARPAPAPARAPAPHAGETVSQSNAREKASDYIDLMSFSRSGLIHQLEFEGFSTADATYGVDALSADWNEQAAKKAADYLDLMAFSRSGLIHQLEFEGFSTVEATYGVDALNADWNEQAAKKAAEYLTTMPFSRSDLIHQLEFEGFTQAEAEHGVSTTGL